MREKSASKRFLRSRWILPVTGPPVRDGIIEIDGENIGGIYTSAGLSDSGCIRLAAAGRLSAEPAGSSVLMSGASHGAGAALNVDSIGSNELIDCGNAILMPGLINLHSHIDYTALRGFDNTSSLFDWIPALMSHVRTWQPQDFLRSAQQGAAALLAAGTTCVIDSSFSGQAAIALGAAGLRAIVALELFGIDDKKVEESWDSWLVKRERLLSSIEQRASAEPAVELAREALSSRRVQLSIAPHAPYTVSGPLLIKAAEWSRLQKLPCCIHLSESAHEYQWTSIGNHVVDSFLLSLHGIITKSDLHSLGSRSCGKSPARLLKDCDVLNESLLAAHCVHLSSADIDLLANHHVGIAHCPRSNARLGNGIAPLRELLASGAKVGFGTDSAASTDNLDLLSEANFAGKAHRVKEPSFVLSAEKAIRMCTIDAAASAGLADSIGSLEPGKSADIAIFSIDNAPDCLADSPYEALLYGQPSLKAVYVAGRKLETSYNQAPGF